MLSSQINAWLQDWSFFDAFYFCFITSTTIGFGDLTPDIAGNGEFNESVFHNKKIFETNYLTLKSFFFMHSVFDGVE